MNSEQRQTLVLLLQQASELPVPECMTRVDVLYKNCCVIIDEFLRNRETELRAPLACGHPTIFLELVPIEEQKEAIITVQIGAQKLPESVIALPSRVLVDSKKLLYRCSQCRKEKELFDLAEILQVELDKMAIAEETVPKAVTEIVSKIQWLTHYAALQPITEGENARTSATKND